MALRVRVGYDRRNRIRSMKAVPAMGGAGVLLRRITCEMIMRSVPMIGVVVAGLLVASCSSLSSFLPRTPPPRPPRFPHATPPPPPPPPHPPPPQPPTSPPPPPPP